MTIEFHSSLQHGPNPLLPSLSSARPALGSVLPFRMSSSRFIQVPSSPFCSGANVPERARPFLLKPRLIRKYFNSPIIRLVMGVSYNGSHFTPTHSSISLQYNPVNSSGVFVLVLPTEGKGSEISANQVPSKIAILSTALWRPSFNVDGQISRGKKKNHS